MFGFKLWSNFGSFRDPLTVTQNLTLNIPPKTTIGGILAAILGIDYNKYFLEDDYFDFQYSIIIEPNKVIRKKTFAQNYVEDYTKKSQNKFSAMKDYYEKQNAISTITKEPNDSFPIEKKRKTLAEKLSKKEQIFKNNIQKIGIRMTKPKPIFRELLINPSFFIFVENYKYEKKIVEVMKQHYSIYPLYMGNSEFPANYKLLSLEKFNKENLYTVDSFTQHLDQIKFGSYRKYSTVYFATEVTGNRKYRNYRKIVICDKPISFKQPVLGYTIKTSFGEFNCEFI